METAPANVVAGTAFAITVIAIDHLGNNAAAYTGTIHFTSSDKGAGSVVAAFYTFAPADLGIHVFTAPVLVTAATQTFTATDNTTASVTGSTTVTVKPAAATHLGINAPPTVKTGSPFSITVTAEDPFNNTVTGYTGTVHFTKSDAGANSAVPADYTYVAADNGTHIFSGLATLVTLGNQSITATDVAAPAISGSAAVTVLSTVTWINPAGGDWDTASNWDAGRVPAAFDDVVINIPGITVTHSTSATDSVHSLTCAGCSVHLRRHVDRGRHLVDQRCFDTFGRRTRRWRRFDRIRSIELDGRQLGRLGQDLGC